MLSRELYGTSQTNVLAYIILYKACHYSCATCSNPTTCDTCNPKSYRKLNGLCVCQSPTVDVVP